MRILIKLGGAALQDSLVGRQLCKDLKSIQEAGFEILVVHGGGPRINQELNRRGIEWSFIDGQRVTPPEMMEVIEMVLCGQVGREIVKNLQNVGVNSIGFSGVDARLFECVQLKSELGQVGKIERVNSAWMESLLEFRLTDGSQSLLPVIAPVGIGVGGESYNINADWAASSLAQAMKVDQLIYVTDQNGVLDGQCEMGGELISELDLKSMGRLIQTQVVRGGMLAKLNAVQSALNGGVPKVWIVNGRSPGILKQLLLEKINTGTRCTPGLNQPLFLEKEEVIHV